MPAPLRAIDLRQTRFPYLERFLSQLGLQPGEDLLDQALSRAAPVDFEQVPLDRHGTSGKDYWLSFLVGFREFLATGAVSRANSHFKYLHRLFASTRFDPALAPEFEQPELILQRIAARYATLRRLREDSHHQPLPVVLFVDPIEGGEHVVRFAGSRMYLACARMDGYHRIFSALIAGRDTIACVVELIGQPAAPTT